MSHATSRALPPADATTGPAALRPAEPPAGRTTPGPSRGAGSGRGGDTGSASIEFLGFLPILILVALAAVQLGIAAYAVQQAGTAARAAARTGSLDEPGTPAAAGTAAISGWLADETNINGGDCGGGEAHATARVKIPSVFPGITDFGSAKRSATMPCDDGQLQAGGRP
ncbi:TadE/TadG family type IV pilus assembly protein [Streptomyces sp. NPDC021212]|uniref:TadE/TadG family type IV pilus assembly protein n=1 Tax=Streptomyces sp. NPDC021212 TaxID=3365118 RepID=UPI0037A9B41C